MRRGSVRLLLAVLVSAGAAGAQTTTEAEADSLLQLYEESGTAPEEEIPLPECPSPGRGLRLGLDAGATRTRRWYRGTLRSGPWHLRAGRRESDTDARTDLSLTVEGDRVGAGFGRIALRGGAGLLLGGTGRNASPSASQGLAGGRSGWRAVAGEPSAGSLRGGACAVGIGWLDLRAAAGEGDRNGDLGGGGQTRQAVLRLVGRRMRAGLVWLDEDVGSGAGLSLSLDDGPVRGVAEYARWRPGPGAAPRAAWTTTFRIPGRALSVEAQLAVREPGFAPRPGRRPAALGADDRWGWALRGRGRLAGCAVSLMSALARGERELDDRPAVREVRRFEAVLSGRAADEVAWRLRVADRLETLRGWEARAAWLPAAEASARRVTRLSLRGDGRVGDLGWRAALEATGVSTRDADGEDTRGWRRRLVLRCDRDLGGGLGLRLNQVWAWGEPVDLVSVEVPAPGFLRPRHWGRRERERSLGLCWRGRGWRLSAAYALWDESDGGAGSEVLARLVRGP